MSKTVQQLGSYTFSHVCVLQPETDSVGNVLCFSPQSLFLNRNGLRLNPYGRGPFCRFRIPANLRDEGVYALTLNGVTQYIGECIDLSSRYNAGYGQISPRNCYERGQPTNCRINGLLHRSTVAGGRIDLWFCKTEGRKQVEQELLTLLRPPWNFKGVSATHISR